MPDAPTREEILRQCLATDPAPWHPRDYAAAAGVDRESLYGPLNDLRIAGLVTLTEWVAGKGQGYVATPLGREALADPAFLMRLAGTAPIAGDPPADPDKVPTTFDRGEDARNAMYFPKPARVVPVLMGINIAAFLASFAVSIWLGVPTLQFLGGGEFESIDLVGGVTAGRLARGEWWRLITNTFLHYGLLHLSLNMLSLVMLRRGESLWGRGRFVALYLVCGVCGSCAAVWFQPGDLQTIVQLAGASGSLWGLMAGQAVWLILNRRHLPAADIRLWMQQIFLTLVLNVGVSMLPHVSVAAHLGGGIAGALSAVFLQIHRYGPPGRRSASAVMLAAIPVLFLFGLATAFERDRRLQPFIAEAYRLEVEPKIGRLAARIDELEPRADALHVVESSRRDPETLESLRGDFSTVVREAKDTRDWVKESTAAPPAKPLRDRSQAVLEALVDFADGLSKHAAGEVVADLNDRRRRYRDALANWKKLADR